MPRTRRKIPRPSDPHLGLPERVSMIVLKVEFEDLDDSGRATNRRYSNDIAVFPGDFGKTISELLVEKGVEKESL